LRCPSLRYVGGRKCLECLHVLARGYATFEVPSLALEG
jgi:hypothetical protein